MTAKKSKKENKLNKAKGIVKKINNDLIDASFQAIETTVKAGEKWQKLTKKLIKKAEPLTKQQMNMVVETAETLKEQVESSTERLKDLVGYDPKMVEQAKQMISSHPVVEKAEALKDKIEKEVASNKFVKKAEKMTNKLKKQISETIEDVKEKVEDYTEDIVEDVKEKVEDVKDKVEDLIGLEEKPKKKATKKAPAKKSTAKKVVEKVVIAKTDVKNNLKVIKGIGPKLEETLNKVGITAYAQLAKVTLKDLRAVLTEAGVNPKMYDLSGWKSQAKEALKK
ncbi:MAG: hypothetical protein ED556_11830 [Winogradskyella sp.]|uniref:hypothetical protein n=1 Tax=Winogradskyella sp. TaxID=1883156 RepID=UPI000F3BFA82|nr:hypothetical protein [Winogradskyella sp.]RNC84142.1 MAG: hypothetical protein ED556_11830 [Winogradskyella sp.]